MQGHILALGELLDKEYDTLDIIEFDESSKLFDSMNYLSNELGLNVLDNLKKQCDSYCSVFEHDILRVDAVPRNATFDLSYAMLQFPIYGIETRFNDVESLLEQVDMILEEEENEHYVSKVIAESVQVFDTEKMKFRTARELLAMDFARDPDYAYTESSDDEFSEKMQRSIYAIELSKRFSNLQAYISNNGPDVVQSHVVNRYVVNSSDDFSTREILDVEFNSQLGLYLSGQMELGEICGNFGFELPNEVQNNGYLLFDSMRRIAFLHKKLRKVDGGERQYVLDDIKDVMLPDELLQDQGKIGQVAKTIYLGLSEKLYI